MHTVVKKWRFSNKKLHPHIHLVHEPDMHRKKKHLLLIHTQCQIWLEWKSHQSQHHQHSQCVEDQRLVDLVKTFKRCVKQYNCMKSVRFRSFSSPYFPAFGLNTERYSVSLYSVRMRENMDQKNSKYRYVSHRDIYSRIMLFHQLWKYLVLLGMVKKSCN